MRPSLDISITVTLVLCAIVTTSIVVHREFLSDANTPVTQTEHPKLLEGWQEFLANGGRIGVQDAPVQLIEFADFECPFCRDFHETVKTLQARYPKQVSLSFIHFPLTIHRFAQPAARVAECAADQGRFEAMHDLLFDQQDQLGLKPWDDFAKEADVPDPVAFDACIRSTAPVPRVEAGKALGERLDIHGTPTLIINGWKLPQPPSLEKLDSMVKAILAGKSPLPTD